MFRSSKGFSSLLICYLGTLRWTFPPYAVQVFRSCTLLLRRCPGALLISLPGLRVLAHSDRMADGLLEAVRGLHLAHPELGPKPLLAKLRQQQPDLAAGNKEVREALAALKAEESNRW